MRDDLIRQIAWQIRQRYGAAADAVAEYTIAEYLASWGLSADHVPAVRAAIGEAAHG